MKIAPSVRGVLLLCRSCDGRFAAADAQRSRRSNAGHPRKAPRLQRPRQPTDAGAKEPPLVPIDDPFIKSFEFAPMGTVYVYLPKKIEDDTDIVLFASGDGGWSQRAIDMFVAVAGARQIVVGFSTPEYLKRVDASKLKCAYPAGRAGSV